MYSKPQQMEPLFPSQNHELEDMACRIISGSAALGGQLHPVSRQAVVELLRIINSYYSNLIEGHSTHPADIERAMRQDYSSDPAKRDLQMESLSHINCQRQIEARLQGDPSVEITSTDFIVWVHRLFYDQLAVEHRQVKNEQSGEVLEVVPGELRQHEVEVGRHVGPASKTLTSFLARFSSGYAFSGLHGVVQLIATAASHHRLMWIHPFLDGNGRVARLYTDACLHRFPLRGYGLWNVSRGLARKRNEYMSALGWADAPRRNDLDGRGHLSNEGLVKFCKFFFEVCIDQIAFMESLLGLDTLIDRVKGYVAMRAAKLLESPVPGHPTLKPEAEYMILEVLLRGQQGRGEVIRATGMAERSGRMLLGQLIEEGILVSDTPKGAVRISFPTHLANYLFPDLYPAINR